MFNPWFSLGLNVLQAGLEAQNVIALRAARLAAGGALAQSEASRMVSEKVFAAGEAYAAASLATLKGQKPEIAAKRALNVYRRRMHANQRRLSGS